MLIRVNKGLHIALLGTPANMVDSGKSVKSVAVLGRDYVGLRPKMMVEVGNRVVLGQALFVDKRDPDVMYAAPGMCQFVRPVASPIIAPAAAPLTAPFAPAP